MIRALKTTADPPRSVVTSLAARQPRGRRRLGLARLWTGSPTRRATLSDLPISRRRSSLLVQHLTAKRAHRGPPARADGDATRTPRDLSDKLMQCGAARAPPGRGPPRARATTAFSSIVGRARPPRQAPPTSGSERCVSSEDSEHYLTYSRNRPAIHETRPPLDFDPLLQAARQYLP